MFWKSRLFHSPTLHPFSDDFLSQTPKSVSQDYSFSWKRTPPKNMQFLPCVYSLPMKHFVEPFTYLESDKNKVDVTQIEAMSTLQISSLVCEWLSTIDRTETMWISATVWSVLVRHWHGWQHCADVLGLLVKNCCTNSSVEHRCVACQWCHCVSIASIDG